MKKLLYLVTIVFGLFLLSSCVSTVRSPQPSNSVISITEAEHLIVKYSKRPSVSTVQGMAKIRLLRNGKWNGGSHVLKLSRPGNIFAETLSLFGQTLAKTTSDGQSFSLYVPGENRLYSGIAEAAQLKRVFAVEISSDELVSILLYDVVFSTIDKFDEILQTGEGLTSFHYSADDRRMVAIFDREGDLVQYRVDDELEVTYADFFDMKPAQSTDRPGGLFPRKVVVKGLKEGVALEVTFTDVDFNRTINQADFTMKVPDGTLLVPLLD